MARSALRFVRQRQLGGLHQNLALAAVADVGASCRDCFFNERERWALWLPVMLGVGIGIYFLLPAEPDPWVAVIAILTAATVLLLTRKMAVWGW